MAGKLSSLTHLQVMPGYFKNPSATSETLVEGWCHTGDIGYYDQVGAARYAMSGKVTHTSKVSFLKVLTFT